MTLTELRYIVAVAREHQAARERVSLFDQTSFSKFLLVGRDAGRALDWICANDVAKPVGSLVYTQMLNARGGIECDLTVARLADDRYYLVTGTGFATHDFDWIARQLPAGCEAQLVDVTSAYAVLALMGPLSRRVLERLTRDEIRNGGFPFGQARTLQLAGAPVTALRVTYVGELGWELHVPVEFAASVYAALMQAGAEFGIANAGYRAIDSCRMEKGYLYWSGDISPDYNPYEAGLGFCVALDKGDFIGCEALVKIKAAPPARKLCSFVVDGFAPFHGGEAILRDGKVVGSTTSTGFGHTLGRTIAFGYLPAGVAAETAFDIEAFGRTYRAMRGPRCLYDAKMERLRG